VSVPPLCLRCLAGKLRYHHSLQLRLCHMSSLACSQPREK
jgi:hypothetical protein